MSFSGEIDRQNTNNVIFAAGCDAKYGPGLTDFKKSYLLSIPLNEIRTPDEQAETAKTLNEKTDGRFFQGIDLEKMQDYRYVPEYHGQIDGLMCFIQWQEKYLLCRTTDGLELYER